MGEWYENMRNFVVASVRNMLRYTRCMVGKRKAANGLVFPTIWSNNSQMRRLKLSNLRPLVIKDTVTCYANHWVSKQTYV